MQEGAHRLCLGVEGGQAGLECLCIVVLPADEGLAGDIVLAGGFGRSELFVVGAAARWVYQSAGHTLHLRGTHDVSQSLELF